jgi:hypothetical protein
MRSRLADHIQRLARFDREVFLSCGKAPGPQVSAADHATDPMASGLPMMGSRSATRT